MRPIFLALICLALAGCASTRNDPISSLEIKEIKPRYIPEENFKRIGEYWKGAENQGNRVILRTNPEIRDGFYFTLVLDEKLRRLPRGTVITGEFYTGVSKDLQTHEFRLPSGKLPKTREIFLGLTGADWPEAVRDANGKQLAQKQSYLWSI
jgi:hypothetical protein